MLALMALVKRGDRALQSNRWMNIYTPMTVACAETRSKCLESMNGFDGALCWIAKFDTSRYTIPEEVQKQFGDRGIIR